MIEREIRKVMQEVEETVKSIVYCDVCKKRVPIIYDGKWQKYYEVMTGHNDWGNDSCDSIDTQQCCSYNCALIIATQWFEENSNSDTAWCNINIEVNRFVLQEKTNNE